MSHTATKIGTEFQVNTYTTNHQEKPLVASFSDGGFVVTWHSRYQDGSEFGVYGQLYNSVGEKSGTEFQVNTYTESHQTSSSVASFSDGGFVVIWASDGQDGSVFGIYGQLYDSVGEKSGTEFQVNTCISGQQFAPSVAVFSYDGFIVTWHSDNQDGSSWGVYGQLYNSAGEKSGTEFQINTYTAGEQSNPSVATFSYDGFIVTWHGQDGSSLGIYGQLYNNAGEKSGTEFQVNTYTISAQSWPSVASFSDGRFIVTWQSDGQDGSSLGIYGQLYNSAGEKSSAEFQVNTYTSGGQSNPSVASFSDGGFVVTWQSADQDGGSYGIYGQLFSSAGEKSDTEFQINTYILGEQSYPSVASFSNGRFVVVWHSYQDGSNLGTYGQLYGTNILPQITSFTKIGSEDAVVTFSASDFTSHYNDTDTDSLFKIQVVSLSINGVLKLSGTSVEINQEIDVGDLSNLTFEPSENWNGETSFGWKGHDGTSYSINTASVDITIDAVDDGAPIITNIPKIGTEDVVLTFTISDFTSHFSDVVDGDALTKIQIIGLPSSGVLKLSGTPVESYQEIAVGDLSSLTFEPNEDWNGVTSFGWKGHDGTSYSINTASVDITIDAVNDTPVVTNISKGGVKNIVTTFTTSDFINKFSDVDGDPLAKIQIIGLPGNGNLKLSGTPVESYQEIVVGDLSGLTFEPNEDWNGETSFGWKGHDGLVYSNVAGIEITIISNDSPIVTNIPKTGTEDVVLTFTVSDFTSHFSDADGDALTKIQIIDLPSNGVLKLSETSVEINQEIDVGDLSSLTFEPNEDWYGETSFGWKGHDGTSYSINTASVEIDITNVPESTPPTVSDFTKKGLRDDTIIFSVSDFTNHYTDVEGDPLSRIQVISLPDNGILKVSGTDVILNQEIQAHNLNHLKFVPSDWYGTTSFYWKGHDGTSYSTNTASVDITINTSENCLTIKNVEFAGVGDLDRDNEELELEIRTHDNDRVIDCGLFESSMKKDKKSHKFDLSISCKSEELVKVTFIERDYCNDDFKSETIKCLPTETLEKLETTIQPDGTVIGSSHCEGREGGSQACIDLGGKAVGGSFCGSYAWSTEDCVNREMQETDSEYYLTYEITPEACTNDMSYNDGDYICRYEAHKPSPVCDDDFDDNSAAAGHDSLFLVGVGLVLAAEVLL